MNDNKKSSQDFEFDFNNPKSTDKIVDQSMIKNRNSVDPDKMKGGAIGLFAFIVLGYYFFGSSVKKEVLPDHQANVVEAISKMPQDAANNASKGVVASLMEEGAVQPLVATQQPEASPEALKGSVPVAPPIVIEKAIEAPVENTIEAPVEKSVAMPSATATTNNTTQHDAIEPVDIALNATPVVDLSLITQKLDQHKKELQKIIAQQADKSDAMQNNFIIEMRKYNAATTKQLDRLEKEQAALLQTVQQIAGNLGANDAQLKKIEQFINAEIAEFAQPMGMTPAPIAPKYVVHAIIPGRAWLRDPQQRITSITEGQLIEGYGTVLTIDPKMGTVILSSGQVLRY